MAAQEIQLIGQGNLLRGADIGVQVVDGVFPQLPAGRAGGCSARAARRGDAVGCAGLHQQWAGNT